MGGSLGKGLLRLACGLAVALVTLVLTLGVGLRDARAEVAAQATDAAAYPLWIGETQVTSENLQGQGWSFDPATSTLVLDGFAYTGTGHPEVLMDFDGEYYYWRHASIFWNAESTLVVELAGENRVTVTRSPDDEGNDDDESEDEELEAKAASDEDDTDPDFHCYSGIYSAGNLTLKGAGSLVAQTDESLGEGSGICAEHDVHLEGSSLTGRGTVNGIESSQGAIVIGEGAGTITAETFDYDGSLAGIYVPSGDIRVEGGTVAATGYYGMRTGNGVVINGGEVSAVSSVPVTYEGSIMTPCGIYSEDGLVVINGGVLTAKGFDYGIYSRFHQDYDEDDEDYEDYEDDELEEQGETAPNGVVINGGSVIAEAWGSGEAVSGKVSGKCSAICVNADMGGSLMVTGGSVQAISNGEGTFGINVYTTGSDAGQGSVVIEEGVSSLVASGTGGAFSKGTVVKNKVAGMGWSDASGTEGKTIIGASTDGQALNSYQRVQLPAAMATVTTPPVGKNLTYNGQPQVLVEAGVAEGGELQYSLDGKSYSAELPSATDAGNYTIYYRVIGDAGHIDSEAQTVTAVIASTPVPTPAPTPTPAHVAPAATTPPKAALPQTGDPALPTGVATLVVAGAGIASVGLCRRRRG